MSFSFCPLRGRNVQARHGHLPYVQSGNEIHIDTGKTEGARHGSGMAHCCDINAAIWHIPFAYQLITGMAICHARFRVHQEIGSTKMADRDARKSSIAYFRSRMPFNSVTVAETSTNIIGRRAPTCPGNCEASAVSHLLVGVEQCQSVISQSNWDDSEHCTG